MSRKLIQIAFSIFLLAGLALGFAMKDSALAQDNPTPKIEAGLLEQLNNKPADFIIMMAKQADVSAADKLKTKIEKGQYVFDTLVATANSTQTDLRAYLDSQKVDYKSFYIVNAIWVKQGTLGLAQAVALRSDVASISANHTYQLEEPINRQPSTSAPQAIEPNLSFINVDDVWAMGINGTGTIMGDNDTGLTWTHPAIIAHYRGCQDPPDCTVIDHNYNWYDAFAPSNVEPWDDFGHGTHTTGTMVGDDGLGNQIGVAPGAKTIHCKNMLGGGGDDAHFITCFEWDLAPWDLSGANPLPSMAPDAVNNSWGYFGGGQSQFRVVVDNLQAAGILVEVSAGNEGTGCQSLRSPGDYLEVLTTGSVDHTGYPFPGSITGFSSRGPSSLDGNYFPDIMAPGNGIRSSVYADSYEYWSGTSMAGPHATGLIGLIWSANPALRGQVAQTIDIIHQTAVPLTGQTGSNCGGDYTTGPNNDWGVGTIDAAAAVQLAIAMGGSGQLDGTVTDAITGTPIDGANVHALHEEGFAWDDETDVTGYYTMTVGAGTFTVTASHPQYEDLTISSVEVITDQLTTQNFALTPRGILVGYVTDFDNGFPLVGATVSANDGSTSVTDDLGYYEMFLDEGTYTVTASMQDYAPETAVVDIVSGDSTQQDFALQAAIVFSPSPLHVTVDLNDTGSSAASILNRLPSDYAFEFREKDEGFIPLGGKAVNVVVKGSPASAPADTAVAAGPYQARPDRTIAIQHQNGINQANVLLLNADDDNTSGSPIQQLLLAYGDLGAIDLFDARYATPTLEQLQAYNVVVVWANYTFLDATGMGNVLADYVDAGGKVIDLNFALDPNWGYQGRFRAQGYTAMTITNTSYSNSCLGVYDEQHPVMEGVTAGNVCDFYRGNGTVLTAGSYTIASWQDGLIFVAAKDDQSVVTIGGYVGLYFQWTGQMADVLHNAINWLAVPPDVPWFTEVPISGTVPAGETLPVTVNFTATAAVGINQPGDYLATLKVDGDPSVNVPVVMTVLPPATWGKLDGTITDLCTGNPIEEALVAIPTGVPITQTMSNESGYFWVWLDQGTYDVNFSAPGYISQDASLEVLPGETTTNDVQLVPDKACITVEPDKIEAWLLSGTEVYTTGGLTIGNIGAQALNWEIREKDGGFAPGSVLKAPDVKPLPVVENPGSASVLQLPVSSGNVQSEPASPNAWTSGNPYPQTIVRYAKVQCPGDNNSFYIFGGVSNGTIVNNARRYDASDDSWNDLAPMPVYNEGPNGVCNEGKIYVTEGGGLTGFSIYDIASNTWSTGAALPRGVECGAMAAWNGKVYLIGGDDDFFPSNGVSDQVNIYDIATNSWTGTGTPMPAGVSNNGFVQLGNYIYIVGGWWIGSTGTNSDMTLRYDLETDTWETGAVFSPARADFPVAATSQYLYAIGGDQSGGGYWDASNIVWRYDFSTWPSGAWEDVGDNLPFPIQAHFGGFTTDVVTGGEIWSVGGLDLNSGNWHADNLYRAAEPPWSPLPSDVPWVWETPITGTIAPEGDQAVDVYVTAMSDTVPLPLGTYTATLRVLNNDSVAGVQNVLVVMHIVEAFAAPSPEFDSNSPINVGESMEFLNLTEDEGVPPADNYEWDFGDGITMTVGTKESVSHVYATFGTFTVTLTACNSQDLCGTIAHDVVVLPKVILLPLVNKN